MYPLFLATHNPAERSRCAGRLNLNSHVPGFASHKHQEAVRGAGRSAIHVVIVIHRHVLSLCLLGRGGVGECINPFTVPGFASHKHHDAVRGAERSAVHVVIHRHVLSLCLLALKTGLEGRGWG